LPDAGPPASPPLGVTFAAGAGPGGAAWCPNRLIRIASAGQGCKACLRAVSAGWVERSETHPTRRGEPEDAMKVTAVHRKVRTTGFAAFALIAGLSTSAVAQTDPAANYPNKTIKIVVGFAAGGGNDIIARIIGQKLQDDLGQTVIIENKVGAGGSLAALFVMAAPPDGYTLLVNAAGAMSIIPAISVRRPYSTLRGFAPVSNLASFPLILSIHPSHPSKNVQELVAWLKANPDKSNYATSSSAFTLATELFKLKTGAPGTGIPYKSSNEMLVSVIAQQSLFTIT